MGPLVKTRNSVSMSPLSYLLHHKMCPLVGIPHFMGDIMVMNESFCTGGSGRSAEGRQANLYPNVSYPHVDKALPSMMGKGPV